MDRIHSGDKTLAIANVGEQWKPSDQGTGAALEVENFDEAINQLRNQGAPFAAEPFETPLLSHGGGARSRRKQTHNSQTQTRKRERSLQMITNEVAFVAIAVSDKERARKFYQETLELKPTRTQMDGAWVEYDLARPQSESVVTRHGNLRATEQQSRSRSEDFDDAVREAQRTRCDVRHGKI